MDRRRGTGVVIGVGLFSILLIGAAAGVFTAVTEDGITDGPAGDATGSEAGTPPPTPTPTPGAEEVERGGTLAVWAREDLPPGFATSVESLPGVLAAAEVLSDTLGLVGARDVSGEPVLTLDGGFRIPVEVAAVEPATYSAVLADLDAAQMLGALRPGSVLLTEAGAELRGIGVGGEIDLAGLSGLEVVGIIPSGSVRRAEIVLHVADSGTAGLEDDPSVVARHDLVAGAETDALVTAIEGLIPRGTHARVVATGGDSRRVPLVLSLTEVKQQFGEFAFRPREGAREIDVADSFTDAHITSAEVPLLGTVTCHRDIVDDLRGALEQIVTAGLAGEIDPTRYGGCYYPRRISTGRSRLSHHSWGIALDVNVDLSLPGLGPPPHPGVVEAFEDHGFRWGGDFLTPDNHHFEWIGTVTEAPRSTGG